MTDSATETLYIGMISGTSRDGVDTVLVRFDDDRPRILASLCLPYPDDLANSLGAVVDRARRPTAREQQNLDQALADVFSRAINEVLAQAGVRAEQVLAVGSHGQTVWHNPDAEPPETLQLGDPGRIAASTGMTVVGDFRQADLQAGGQGAPLAPLIHRALFRPTHGERAVVNLGGIANVSYIEASGRVSGHDTGPANCLMDGWIRRCRHQAFDRDGAWAAGGNVNPGLLQALLDDPYFRRPPPKSTGVEYFSGSWLDDRLNAHPSAVELPPRDVQATLCELTAQTLADDFSGHPLRDVLLCGGGAHNLHLRKRIQALSGCEVLTTEAYGLHPDWVEAVLFAWLARERLECRPQDTTLITGASRPVLLGDLFSPPG